MIPSGGAFRKQRGATKRGEDRKCPPSGKGDGGGATIRPPRGTRDEGRGTGVGGVRLGCGFRQPNSETEFGASVMVTPPYGSTTGGAQQRADVDIGPYEGRGTKDGGRGGGTPYLGHGLRRPNFVPKFGASVRVVVPYALRGDGGRGTPGRRALRVVAGAGRCGHRPLREVAESRRKRTGGCEEPQGAGIRGFLPVPRAGRRSSGSGGGRSAAPGASSSRRWPSPGR